MGQKWPSEMTSVHYNDPEVSISLRLIGQEKKIGLKRRRRQRSVIYDFLRQNYLMNLDLDFHSQI